MNNYSSKFDILETIYILNFSLSKVAECVSCVSLLGWRLEGFLFCNSLFLNAPALLSIWPEKMLSGPSPSYASDISEAKGMNHMGKSETAAEKKHTGTGNKPARQTAQRLPALSTSGTLQRLCLPNWISACGLVDVQLQQRLNGSQSFDWSSCGLTFISWQTTLSGKPVSRLKLALTKP